MFWILMKMVCDFDDTVDDHENPGVTLVSEDGDLMWAARRRSYQI